MYSIDWALLLNDPPRNQEAGSTSGASARVHRTPRVWTISRTVWALGATSLLTDISSEMVASVLPLYLVLHLGMSPLAFGLVDGLYQGAAALVRVIAGVLSDRWQRPKAIAISGYAISAACRVLLLAGGNAWSSITSIVVADRIGKGIRTAPRDALISHSSQPALLATAFGVHRALDATGAMLGPVIAFAVLAAAPRGFDLLFMISFVIAVLGVGVIGLFVPKDDGLSRQRPSEATASAVGALSLLADREYRGLVAAGAILALGTISDAFIYLLVQRRLEAPMLAFPLLYVGTSLFTAMCSVPCGRLADRLGRGRVLLAGYVLLGAVYALLLSPGHVQPAMFAGVVVMALGGYYAATDGVLTAMAASRLSPAHTGTGLSVLTTAVNLSRLGTSIAFGWVWMAGGVRLATACYLGLLAVAIILASILIPKTRPHGSIG